ncbi:endolytic transglycosylase MltG [uncultured Sphaerochaeta sp.]|uniref:endolytic transglycosylase MltG n=1 Tax=uncultured Sphaerochaeta sp. TaxID=886478 RepID=UPI002A0A9265|nr:endolytic transglycosylase MltG [uncultured Sphaerochaeta sp.]
MASKKDDEQLVLDLGLPLKEKHPPVKKKALPNSGKIILDSGSVSKIGNATPRKKPQVSSRKMTVSIPGGPEKSEVKAPKTLQEPSAEKTSRQSKSQSSEKMANKVNKSNGTVNKKDHVTKKQTVVRTAERIDSPLVQSRKPKELKSVARKTVQPPKIGKRKGYRQFLSSRLILFSFFLAAILCIAVLLLTFIIWKQKPYQSLPLRKEAVSSAVQQRKSIAVQILPGMTARQVCQLLEQSDVTSNGQELLDFLVSQNLSSVLRSGSYLLQENMDNQTIATQLTASNLMVSVVIPPAFTLASIDEYLENRGYCSSGDFLQAAEDLKVAYGLSFSEGWLLSGTYSIQQDSVATGLVVSMYEAMLKTLNPLLDSPMVSRYGVDAILIVASMIQSETQNEQEMPLIASVIYNRLDSGQPLGIDATTRYELGDWNNPIPTSALETQTPYNTRRKVGLIPSGICCPSAEALKAACYPKKTDYFYYLHGKDKLLHLAKTYEEHKQNIEKYR